MVDWSALSVAVLLVAVMASGVSGGPTCYQCSGLTSPGCNTLKACADDEVCYADRAVHLGNTFAYNYGCKKQTVCAAIHGSVNVIPIGRRDVPFPKLGTREAYACHKCCYSNNCNAHLCDDSVGLTPSQDIYVSLIGGSNAFEGLVEVFHNGQWGSICDDHWTGNDAAVVCRMLGYSTNGAGGIGQAHYGASRHQIWLDEVTCAGTEASLSQCQHQPWGITDCGHNEDAGVGCTGVAPEDDVIFLSDTGLGGVIFRMNLNTGSFASLPISNQNAYGSFDYDPLGGRLYVVDPRLRQILSIHYDGSDVRMLHQLPQDSDLEKIEVDPQAGLVFFTDDGRNTVGRMKVDGTGYQEMITTNLDRPREIVLDPRNQMIYWSDWGATPKIERAKYDGSSRQTFVSTGLKWPNGLSLDMDENRLYFCDGGTFKIESVDLNGGTRRTVLEESGAHFFALDSFGPYVYYTDWNRNTLMRVNKDGSAKTSVGPPGFRQLSDITIHQYGRDLPGVDPTGPVHFDPSHVFVRLNGQGLANSGRVEVYANGQWGAVCDDNWDNRDAAVICSMLGYARQNAQALVNSSAGHAGGLLILLDEVNCTGTETHLVQCGITPDVWGKHDCGLEEEAGVVCSVADSEPNNFVVFTDSQTGLVLRMDLDTFSTTALPERNSPNPIAVAYNPADRRVYFSEVVTSPGSFLASSTLEGDDWRLVKQMPSGSVVDGLAVDGYARKLFFTDTGSDAIYSINIDGSGLTTIINSGLDQPRGIVLDPTNQMMYWTDWGSNPKIESAHYDGSNRQTLVSTGLQLPNGLVLDAANNMLYFCDAGTHQIERVSTTGSGRTVIFADQSAHFFGLALAGNYIYYSDWAKHGVMRINKDGSGQMMAGAPAYSRVNGLAIYQA